MANLLIIPHTDIKIPPKGIENVIIGERQRDPAQVLSYGSGFMALVAEYNRLHYRHGPYSPEYYPDTTRNGLGLSWTFNRTAIGSRRLERSGQLRNANLYYVLNRTDEGDLTLADFEYHAEKPSGGQGGDYLKIGVRWNLKSLYLGAHYVAGVDPFVMGGEEEGQEIVFWFSEGVFEKATVGSNTNGHSTLLSPQAVAVLSVFKPFSKETLQLGNPKLAVLAESVFGRDLTAHRLDVPALLGGLVVSVTGEAGAPLNPLDFTAMAALAGV